MVQKWDKKGKNIFGNRGKKKSVKIRIVSNNLYLQLHQSLVIFHMKKGAICNIIPDTFFIQISCKTTREKMSDLWEQQDIRPEQLYIEPESRYLLNYLCYLTTTCEEASERSGRIKRFLVNGVEIFSTSLNVYKLFSLKQ